MFLSVKAATSFGADTDHQHEARGDVHEERPAPAPRRQPAVGIQQDRQRQEHEQPDPQLSEGDGETCKRQPAMVDAIGTYRIQAGVGGW